MNHYLTASYSTFLKVEGELLHNFSLQPNTLLFDGSKTEPYLSENFIYKNNKNEFIMHRNNSFEGSYTHGFKSLLTALFYCHSLSKSPTYFELLDKEGELVNSTHLRIEAIGQYQPSDLNVLYIETKSDEAVDDDIDCALVSNAQLFFRTMDMVLARKDDTIQIVITTDDLIKGVIKFKLNQDNIAEALTNILELVAGTVQPAEFYAACKALMQAIGEIGITAPQDVSIAESSFAALGLQPKEVFINKNPSPDELKSFSCHTGIDHDHLSSFKIYGKLVAQTTHLNMDYCIYAANGEYVLTEQSTTRLNQTAHGYTRAFRFYGFNHNTLLASLEINLPVAVCEALQGQLGLPTTGIVHGVISPKESKPFMCIASINPNKEIHVVGQPFTFHETIFAKVSTFLSKDGINLLIVLKKMGKAEKDIMRNALSSFYAISDIDNPERIANVEDTPYLCVSSKHDKDFFGLLNYVFNLAFVEESNQELVKYNTNEVFAFIDKHNIMPSRTIYIS